MANTVSVSAVPFNPNSQSFGSVSPAPQSQAVTNVNKGVPTAAENLAAFQATQPKVPTSANIPVSNIGTQAVSIPTPTTNQQTTSQPVINYPQLYSTAQQQQDQELINTNNKMSTAQASLYSLLSGEASDTANAQNSTDIVAKKQQYQDLSNQILQRTAELNQDDVSLAAGLQNIEDQAIPMQFITGQQASVQNRAQIAKAVKISNINMLNAVAQSVQGNIALAQQTAQDAVDAKYAPIKEQISILQAQQQAIQPLLTSAEKRISEQQSAVYDIQKQLLTNKQNNDKSFMDMIMKAPTDYGATPEQVGKAISIYNQTGDPIQAFAGMNGADQYIEQYNVGTGIRNANYAGVGQPRIEEGFGLNEFKKGIAYVESSGGNNYGIEGPVVTSGMYKGQKALGKYQVMPGNLPSWLKEAGLPNMTPQQFLNSPAAQEKVFETRSLAEYAKYGNWDDVASVWFSGAPTKQNKKDDGYTTVPQYITKYRTGMGAPINSNSIQTNGVVVSPTVITYAKDVAANPDNMKYVPKGLIPQVLAYNQANPSANGQAVTKEDQAKFLIDTIAKAEALSGASGRSKAKQLVTGWIWGATDYTNLQAEIRTVKTNLLTLATDPNIKKFFGPQMTEADVRNMQAAASTLDPELQDPASMQAELLRAKTIFQKFVPGYEAPLPLTSWGSNYYNSVLNSMSGTTSSGYH